MSKLNTSDLHNENFEILQNSLKYANGSYIKNITGKIHLISKSQNCKNKIPIKKEIFNIRTISHAPVERDVEDFLGDLSLLSVCTTFEVASVGACHFIHHSFQH